MINLPPELRGRGVPLVIKIKELSPEPGRPRAFVIFDCKMMFLVRSFLRRIPFEERIEDSSPSGSIWPESAKCQTLALPDPALTAG